MAEFEVPCRNPFDGRPSPVRIRLDGESNKWCNVDFVKSVVCRAFTAAGRAWWDAQCVYCTRAALFCLVPWLRTTVFEGSPGLWGVKTNGMDIVYISIADRVAHLAPKGYPPNATYYLSDVECERVEERMRMAFSWRGAFTPEDITRIYRAFEDLYIKALVKEQIHLRCSNRSCGPDVVAWWGTGKIRLCPLFFSVSEEYAASTLIEELLHGYADVPHNGSPPVEEADFYQNYVFAHYLS